MRMASRRRLGVEALEGRLAPATLTVHSTADTANPTDPYCGDGLVFAYGGGLTEDNGNLSLTGCTVSGNTVAGGNATGFGGGLHAYNSTVTLTSCTVANNTAGSASGDGDGGGLSDLGGTFTLTGCTVARNTAASAAGTGSGGGLYYDGSAGSLRARPGRTPAGRSARRATTWSASPTARPAGAGPT